MVTKEGIITHKTGSQVWVTTTRSKTCDSCESRDSCGEHSKETQMTIKVENSIDADAGDRVVIGFRSAQLMKISFMLYVFPIILMIAGAALGESISVKLGTDQTLSSITTGVCFFIISFLIIRLMNNRWSKKEEYQPFLLRLVQKKEQTPCHIR